MKAGLTPGKRTGLVHMSLALAGLAVVSLAFYLSARGAHRMLSRAFRGVVKKELRTGVPARLEDASLTSVLERMTKSGTEAKKGGVYGAVREDIKSAQAVRFSKQDRTRADRYFESLLKDARIAELSRRTRSYMGEGPQAEAAARWMTLGVIFSSQPDYANALTQSLVAFNKSPEEVYARLQEKLPEMRKDPFIYQMALNLTYQLDVHADRKGELLAREAQHQLENMPASKPSDSFWVALNGLTLAKQANANPKLISDAVSAGLEKTQGPPNVVTDVRAFLASEFPGSSF